MQRVLGILYLLLTMVAAQPFLAAAENDTSNRDAERPSILWLTAEDMSATLGCWGDAYAHTPNIDRLAQQSVRFTKVFATAPVCSPARSCLINGCYATSLGTQRLRSTFPIPDEMRGFPALLREVGFYCTNNVKTDYNTSHESAIIAASWDDCSATATWQGRAANQKLFAVFNDMTSHQSRTMVWPDEQFRSDVQSRLSAEEIHDPAEAPVPPYYPDTPLIRRVVARYYDCVTVMDKNVGQHLRQLEEDGLADDTIVFFFSDHGSGMPRHKRALLDTGMHVPLLIRFPDKYRHLAPADPGETVDRLISFVDFAPTVLSVCGLSIPEYMQGVPFLGPAQDAARVRFRARDRVDEAIDIARSVRNKQYLYVRNFMPHMSYHQPSYWPGQGQIRDEISRFMRESPEQVSEPLRHYAGPSKAREELYDVQADPLNLRNLVDKNPPQRVLRKMRAALNEWMHASHDCGFLPEAEAWSRCRGDAPWDVSQDSERYPLDRLLRAARRVGGDGSQLESLERGLQNREAGVRYWSAVGLAAPGPKAAPATSKLMEATADSSADVRIEAAHALAAIGMTERALSVLTKELESEDANVVLYAARAIELMGEQARSAIPAMQAARQRASREGDRNMFIQFTTDGFLEAMEKP